QLYDALFRPIFAFFLIEHASRRVVQVGVTRGPSDAWVAQQLRNATPDGRGPRFLVRDRDCKYGKVFDRVAAGASIRMIRTPVQGPKANAVCERSLGRVGRECLDPRAPRRRGREALHGRLTKPCCTADGGRSLGVGGPGQAPNRLELRGSK